MLSLTNTSKVKSYCSHPQKHPISSSFFFSKDITINTILTFFFLIFFMVYHLCMHLKIIEVSWVCFTFYVNELILGIFLYLASFMQWYAPKSHRVVCSWGSYIAILMMCDYAVFCYAKKPQFICPTFSCYAVGKFQVWNFMNKGILNIYIHVSQCT